MVNITASTYVDLLDSNTLSYKEVNKCIKNRLGNYQHVKKIRLGGCLYDEVLKIFTPTELTVEYYGVTND